MGSLVLQICLAVIMAFSPWFELYLVLRCCLGFISVGVVFSGFVLCKFHMLTYTESKFEWKHLHYCCSLEQKYFRFVSEFTVWQLNPEVEHHEYKSDDVILRQFQPPNNHQQH